jgi:hypothetical protein
MKIWVAIFLKRKNRDVREKRGAVKGSGVRIQDAQGLATKIQ